MCGVEQSNGYYMHKESQNRGALITGLSQLCCLDRGFRRPVVATGRNEGTKSSFARGYVGFLEVIPLGLEVDVPGKPCLGFIV